MFVAFAADGTEFTDTDTNATYVASSTSRAGTAVTLFVDTLGGASCHLNATPGNYGPYPSVDAQAPGDSPEIGTIVLRWGRFWPANTYQVTATCTLDGITRQATKQVTITP